MDIKHLHALISENKLEEAISLLSEATRNDEYLHSQIISLSTLYSTLKSKENIGALSLDDLMQQRSRISSGLLSIVNLLKNSKEMQEPKKIPEEMPPLSNQKSETRTGGVFSQYWGIFTVAGIVCVFLTWNMFFREPAPAFRRVVINLHGPNSLSDNPVQKGGLSIRAEDPSFHEKADIGQDGHAVFDSVPLGLFGKEIVCALESSPGYVLKEPGNKYIVAETIHVEIKKVAARRPQPVTSCPTTTPSGQPLGSDKPTGTKVGYTAVAGQYQVVNGQCRWILPHWKLNDTSDCPSRPPAGVSDRPQTNMPGHIWKPGHYVKNNGQCVWISGRWEKVANISPPPPRPNHTGN